MALARRIGYGYATAESRGVQQQVVAFWRARRSLRRQTVIVDRAFAIAGAIVFVLLPPISYAEFFAAYTASSR